MEDKSSANNHLFDTIIFDLGAVLIDWNPRYVFKKYFKTKEGMEYFLKNICTSEWNEAQDAGRSFKDGTEILAKQHPQYATEINAFYGEWEYMLGGPIEEMVRILCKLKDTKSFKLVALTNWSAESFPIAQQRYEFLQWFDGILVSGVEKMKKPDPEIYHLLLNRFKIDPTKAIFIDDNMANIIAARQIGIHSIHYQGFDTFVPQFNKLLPNII